MDREIAMACRCQLLIGSFMGATRDCQCESSVDCPFTVEQRDALYNHPKVVEARSKNLAEFERVYGSH